MNDLRLIAYLVRHPTLTESEARIELKAPAQVCVRRSRKLPILGEGRIRQGGADCNVYAGAKIGMMGLALNIETLGSA